MKHVKRSAALMMLSLVVLSLTLFSFSENPGGDTFEVYLNGKLIIRQHVYGNFETASLALDPQSDQDEVKVMYSHCGQTGKDRTVSITDGQNNKVLKQIHFADAATMTFKVKDLGIGSTVKGKLNLVYASKELPKGQLLASITVSKNTQASLH